MKKIILVYFSLLSHLLIAQEISGYVYGINSEGEKEALIGANVFSTDKKYGISTDTEGKFNLLLPKNTYEQLSVSFIGYTSKNVNIKGKTTVTIILEEATLGNVVIKAEKKDVLQKSALDIEVLDSEELTKAACCNLSESFETNAAVDVQFSDAVTGAKRIKMLGLDGYYTQMVFENSTGIRGLENGLGSLFIPGPFMQSIAINKGAGSVVNGYDAITGQINYEYKKPQNSERFFLNLFGSRHGQVELNTNVSHRFGKKWSTLFLLHGSLHESIHDENQDSFQDMAINERINVMNRWRFNSGKMFRMQMGVNYIYDERTSGQLPQLKLNKGKTKLYDSEIVSRKMSAFAKTGFVLNKNNQSIGIQYNYHQFSQNAWIGNHQYKGIENFGRINLMFQTDIKSPLHKLRVGASYIIDDYKETFNEQKINRTESVPGVYAEYSYNDSEKIAFVGGVRLDYHNLHGLWYAPKMNFKYTFLPDFTLKIAAGKGYRTANIYAENISAMHSARKFEVNPNLSYETAWNVGGGLQKKFLVGFTDMVLKADFYHTNFQQQVVIDYENPRLIQFYNLDGTSIANSFQFEAAYEVIKGFDIKLAYKMDDIFITYKSGTKRVPFVPQHKVLLTLDYKTKNEKWRFNWTGKLNGAARLPSTASNSVANQRADISKMFFTMNAQITYVLKQFEFYIGGENLSNYKQKNAIIDAQNPFSDEFDAAMIWAPLDGIKLFGGLRYTLPYTKRKNTFKLKNKK